MPYRLLIFDLDGTLADSFPWYESVFDEIATRYRFARLHGSERDALRALDTRAALARLGVPRWKLPFIARHVRALKSGSLHQIRLFAGVETLLDQLAAGGRTLALVSSDSEHNARRVLGRSSRHFGQFACGASLFGKRAKFRGVLRAARAGRAETLCIGDEIRDLEAARSLGLAFAGVTWGFARPHVLAGRRPDMMFSTIEHMAAGLGVAGPGVAGLGVAGIGVPGLGVAPSPRPALHPGAARS